MLFSLLDFKMNDTCDGINLPTSPNYCCYTSLWKSKHQKCTWTQLLLLMLTTKEPLHASNYIDSCIKYSNESYKWTNISDHVFKVCNTSTDTWSQTIAPLVSRSIDNVLVKVKRSLHQTFSHAVDVLNRFVHALLHNTQISKFKARDDPGQLRWSCDTFWCNFLW